MPFPLYGSVGLRDFNLDVGYDRFIKLVDKDKIFEDLLESDMLSHLNNMTIDMKPINKK